MSNTLPVSVFIIAKNEADRIISPIRSAVSWADEVIVIDSGSDDNTVEVSKALGADVHYYEWQGYGPQKIYGEGLCRNHWILNIDADETVSPELEAEIRQFFAHGKEPPLPAYHIPIRIVSRFAETASRYAPSNNPIRFYDKRVAGFKDSTVHDSVIIKHGTATAGHLQGILLHRCFRSYAHAVQKINYYSTMQAEDMVRKDRKPSSARIVAEPFFAFLKAYFLRRYCLLGIDGFIESIIYAFARTLRFAKVLEKYKDEEGKVMLLKGDGTDK